MKKVREESRWEFGRRLQEVLDRRHMKQYRVAMECEIGTPSLTHYVYGARLPTVSIFMNIANCMNFTDDEIVYILKAFKEEEKG